MADREFQLFWVVGLEASTARSAHKLMARIERTLDVGPLTAYFQLDARTPGIREAAFVTPLDLAVRTAANALYAALTLAWKLGQPWLVGEPKMWSDETFTVGIWTTQSTQYHLSGLVSGDLRLTNEEMEDSAGGDAQRPHDYPAPRGGSNDDDRNLEFG